MIWRRQIVEEACIAQGVARGNTSGERSEMVASSINSVLQRATTTSAQETDKLTTELQSLSDTLRSERAGIQREIVQYSTLTTPSWRAFYWVGCLRQNGLCGTLAQRPQTAVVTDE
jgi:hypothetical protein